MKSLRSLSLLCGTAALMALLLNLTPAAQAQVRFQVTLDTMPLTGSLAANAPFSVLFQLIDGDGVANNTVEIENFSFATGSADGNLQLFGGAAGDMTGGVTLSDSDPGFIFNAFYQDFTPGSSLVFNVALSNNFASGTPDRFSFAVVDNSGMEIPTAGMASELLAVDLIGSDPVIETYSAQADYVAVGPPVLGAVVPEPSPLALLALALPIAVARLRRRHA